MARFSKIESNISKGKAKNVKFGKKNKDTLTFCRIFAILEYAKMF